ncbi:TRAP-type C4-dicarboxylate transport system permease small subunit [Geomicrobium halophilum]|uniref:TRAP-type C4-dicarboxylate transport system permease small subunit n=1 Tax=Geomicrobium halophilum TaxID=549000 RepID=A0A841Q2U6_9BACL|nr:TRAP transporter small permease [Geomicrobium halophilum]MBB6451538.1 TRAP-type C4-dicarboxylate transport system permease small subunit [Geomicrobium halophilum]
MIRALDNMFEKVERWSISSAIILMALVLIGNVISRLVFNVTWTFAEEVGQMLIIIITFIGLSHVARRGRHIRMSAIMELLPYKVQKVMMACITILTSVLLFFLTYVSGSYTVTMFDLDRVTPALRIPLYIMIAVMTFGFFMAGIQYLRTFIRNLKYEGIHEGTESIEGENE